MDSSFTQPKITGYRQLNEAEAELMNEIKAHGEQIGALVAKLRETDGLDGRWYLRLTVAISRNVFCCRLDGLVRFRIRTAVFLRAAGASLQAGNEMR